jgi:hypothetical protein
VEPQAKIADVGSFVRALRDLGAVGMTRPLWFRGHKNSHYRLQASALRDNKFSTNEAAMLKRFMQDALPRLGENPSSDWDWLLLAQHHGVPTRLLDWSENALVGLFFACERDDSGLEEMPEPDGDVWVLMPERLNMESGTWSAQHVEDLPFLGVDTTLERYNPLVLTARQEPLRHIAVIATRNFPRIISQWGTFTITGETVAIEDLPKAETFVARIQVDGEAKAEILAELSSLGVEERVVYPDLHRLGSRVKEMFA